MKTKLPRRDFINTISIAGASLAVGVPGITIARSTNLKPAILGGPKAKTGNFPSWPVYEDKETQELIEVLQSKRWGRLNGKKVANFEREYAELLNAKNCVAVSSGTSALTTIMGALDIGPGDEVIIPVYTFIASYNVITLNYALPVFVDTDIESFQIDSNKVESAITKKTKVIMPVHIGGSPANLDHFIQISKKYNIPLIEDSCQAHLAEWRGRKVGTFGLAGAFSFQASKNLTSGEGGAIVTNDDRFAQTCYAFHNQGQGGNKVGNYGTGSGTRSSNLRLTEFQGGLLLAQKINLAKQATLRSENAAYLSTLFNEIRGIVPAKLYEGTTNSAYHLYMFRYDKSQFSGLSRPQFMEALSAEGVPCSPGYGKMNKSDYVTSLASNKHYLHIYGEKTMKDWLERNEFPENDKLVDEEAVWFTQNMLLGTKADMDQIADAVRKIQKFSKELVNRKV